MAKVNRALEVLSDPQRRDDYDRTGSDGQTMTVAQETPDDRLVTGDGRTT